MTPPSHEPDWGFLRRPFWLFSHVFAATVIVSFVFLGFWQLSRHYDRSAVNEVIEARSQPPAGVLDELLGSDSAAADNANEYQLVVATGSFEVDEVVRVGNRTQGGVAGSHVVGLFRTVDGQAILVNRGFVPIDPSAVVDPAPTGTIEIRGWLRLSVTKGFFGASDPGTGDLVPRLNVEAIAGRLDEPVASMWLQLDIDEPANGRAGFPDPAPLPSTDGGPHLGYMAQWFVFALLGLGFYGALLRRTARTGSKAQPVEAADPSESSEPRVEV